ncbi:MAG: DUF1667 domain-containing protein [Eggerthellaceae bacterium]|nr:DUF1667 domain-containing protein [Eggerthellaceae bacterium]
MAETKTFTCVSCPLGCILEARFDDQGALSDVSGYTCNRGLEYAKQEAVDPQRSISAVVMAQGSLEPLSVKTAQPIPKAKIFDVMSEVRALQVGAPIDAGQVLIEDAAGTGVAIIATKSLA